MQCHNPASDCGSVPLSSSPSSPEGRREPLFMNQFIQLMFDSRSAKLRLLDQMMQCPLVTSGSH